VFDVQSVVDRVAEEHITVLPGPPSIFQSILNHADFASFPLDSLRSRSPAPPWSRSS